MKRIPEETIEEIRQSLIGKRIHVQYTDTKGKRKEAEGICQYFGYNKFFPSWKLQVTIGRTPITHLELSDIKLIE